jgi:phosphate transport system permease protein
LLLLCGLVSIATTLGIVAVLAIEAIRFFEDVSVWEFLSGQTWRPAADLYGVLSLVSGTLTISVLAMLVAIPLGLAAAIYLAEYAPQTVRAIVKPALEIIASVPTIVFGFWALTFITPSILKRISGEFGTFNVMAASIAVGVLTVPLVASLSEDALRAVPDSLREAAYGLGATKLETSLQVVFPAAFSGVVASIILAISRALGETMIVVIAAGNRPAGIPASIFDQAQTMTSYMVNELQGDVMRGTTRYYALFAVGLSLFVVTLILNLISRSIVSRYREIYQ